MDEEEDNLAFTSTFPPPPPHHAQFTAANLALLALVRAAHPSPSRPDKGKQREALVSAGEDEAALPEWDLVAELEEPRVDWIEEDGGYECFGDFYPIPALLADVEAMGVKRLMPSHPPDPKPHLRTLLHSLLHTHLLLLSALTRPPPPLPTSQEEADNWTSVSAPYVDRIAEIGVNMMAGVNELREVQARVTLEQLFVDQVHRRRAETLALNEKCQALSQTLAVLRSAPLPASTIASRRFAYGTDGIPEQSAKEESDVERRRRWESETLRLAEQIP